MTSDDFFTVVKLAPANSDQYSPDYAFLVNVVAVSREGGESFMFGSLPSQADATTILTAARGDPLGRTIFRTTQVKPVVKTSAGNVQRQYKDAPMTMFKVNVDPDSATVYFDAKRQNATIANYKQLYSVLGIVLPEDSALDSIVVNPAGDPSYFLEQVLRAVVTDLSAPGVTLPAPSATSLTKTLTPVGTLATLDPDDAVVVDIPIVTAIDYFPALVFASRQPVTVAFSRAGSTPIELPAGFPFVAKADTATEMAANEFVNDYYPPPNVATIPSPPPKGTLRLTNARMPVVRPPTNAVLENPDYQIAVTNLRTYAARTNTVTKTLISSVNDASFPAVPTRPPGPTGPLPPPGPTGARPPPGPTGPLPPPGPTGPARPGADAWFQFLTGVDTALNRYRTSLQGIPADTPERQRDRDILLERIRILANLVAAYRTSNPPMDVDGETTRVANELAEIRAELDAFIGATPVRVIGGPLPGPTGPVGLPPPAPEGTTGDAGVPPPAPEGVTGADAGLPPPAPVGVTGDAGLPPPAPEGVTGADAGVPPPAPEGVTGDAGAPPPAAPIPMRTTIVPIEFFRELKAIAESVGAQTALQDPALEDWVARNNTTPGVPIKSVAPDRPLYEVFSDEENDVFLEGLQSLIESNPETIERIREATKLIPRDDIRNFVLAIANDWAQRYARDSSPVPGPTGGAPEEEVAPPPPGPTGPAAPEEEVAPPPPGPTGPAAPEEEVAPPPPGPTGPAAPEEEVAPPPPGVPAGISSSDLLPKMKSFIQSIPDLQVANTTFTYDSDDKLTAKIVSALERLRPSESYELLLPTRAAASTDTAVKYKVQTRPLVRFAIVNWKIASTGRTSWSVALTGTNIQSGGARKKPSNVAVQFYIVPTSRARPAFVDESAPPVVAEPPPSAAVTPPPAASRAASPGRAQIPILPPPEEESIRLPGQPEETPNPPPAGVPPSSGAALPPVRSDRFPSEESVDEPPPPVVPETPPPPPPVVPATPPPVVPETPPPPPPVVPATPPPPPPPPARARSPRPPNPGEPILKDGEVTALLADARTTGNPTAIARLRAGYWVPTAEEYTKYHDMRVTTIGGNVLYDIVREKFADVMGQDAVDEVHGKQLPSNAAGNQLPDTLVANRFEELPVRDDGWCFYRSAQAGASRAYLNLDAPPTIEERKALKALVFRLVEWIRANKAHPRIRPIVEQFEEIGPQPIRMEGAEVPMTYDEYLTNLTQFANDDQADMMPKVYPDVQLGLGTAAANVLGRNIGIYQRTGRRYERVAQFFPSAPTTLNVYIVKESDQDHFNLLAQKTVIGGTRRKTLKRGRKSRRARYTLRQQQ